MQSTTRGTNRSVPTPFDTDPSRRTAHLRWPRERRVAPALLSAMALVLSAPRAPAQDWTLISNDMPSARSSFGMSYDSARERTVLFGGSVGTAAHLGDTWEFNGDTGSWTQVATTGPPAMRGTEMVFEQHLGRTMMFGGRIASSGLTESRTWVWNGSQWLLANLNGPSGREGHALAYDTGRNVTVLFGGTQNFLFEFGDTWEWTGTSWSLVSNSGPRGRFDAALAYDPVRDRTVLFGGSFDDSSTFDWTYLRDTWEWNGSSWTLVSNTGPAARGGASLVFDSSRGKLVLFGGGNQNTLFGDTWEWDGSSWTQVSVSGPSARAGQGMVFDDDRDVAVMFGGAGSVQLNRETWEYGVTTLPAPTGVSASDGTSTSSISITWNATPGATHYRVYRDGSAITGWVSGTSRQDGSTTPGVTHSYTVRAASNRSGGQQSLPSSPDSGWRALTPPTAVTASDGTSTSAVHVSWNTSVGASHYHVYRDGSPLYVWTSNTNFADTGADPGIDYTYTVRAATSSSGTHASAESAGDLGWRALPPPTGVAASDGTYTDRVRVSWSSLGSGFYYRVYRGDIPLQGWQTGTTCDDLTVTPGQPNPYHVRVAINSSGDRASNDSNSDIGWRALSPPANVAASDGTSTAHVRVTWSAASGASHYRVTRNGVEVGDWTSSTSFDDEEAQPGVTYSYRVSSATSSSGDLASDASPPDSGWRRLLPPTGISASDGGTDPGIAVSWNATPGASHYRVLRNTVDDPGTASAVSDWTNQLSAEDPSGLPDETYYFFVVAATSSSGVHPSDPSASDVGSWHLETPTGLVASDGEFATHVRVSWSAPSGATHYLLSRDGIPVGGWSTGTVRQDTGATPGADHSYTVQAAANAAGTHATGASAADVGWRALEAPVNLIATDQGGFPDQSYTEVSFDPVPSATHYRILRNEVNDPDTATYMGPWQAATVFEDASSIPERDYFYWAQAALDAAGTRPSEVGSVDSGSRACVHLLGTNYGNPPAPGMLLLLDRSESMNGIRASTGNPRHVDAMLLAVQDVSDFFTANPQGAVAVWTSFGPCPTDRSGGFVDEPTALALLDAIALEPCHGGSPLADALHTSIVQLFLTYAGAGADQRFLTVTSAGVEDSSTGPCAGPNATSGTDCESGFVYDPQPATLPWQQKVCDVLGNPTLDVMLIRFWDELAAPPIGIDNGTLFASLADRSGGVYQHVGDGDELPGSFFADCNANGVLDSDDIANGTSEDLDGDGIPDECENLGVPFCFGDGSASACPCANDGGPGEGCASSTGSGASLVASGSASVGTDDLVLDVQSLPAGQPALLFVGTAGVNGGAGLPFGDGLRCVGGGTERLGVRITTSAGAASWGPGLAAASGWSASDTRHFQVWYRDPGGPCGGGFNLSHALEISFVP